MLHPKFYKGHFQQLKIQDKQQNVVRIIQVCDIITTESIDFRVQ